MTRGRVPVVQAFVDATAGRTSESQCIEWPFKKNKDGYGVVHLPRPSRKTVTAHRAVLMAAGVTCPADASEVRHLCANRSCVNVSHLRWGSRSENQQDRFRLHGDHNRGERNNRSKLTDDAVRTIRASLESGRLLAVEFGVSPAAIGFARSGATWSHVEAVPE